MASNRNTITRSLHDLGAAAWFGGALMGAVGLNGASKDVKDPAERVGLASAGWARWAPVSAAAIGAHLYGGAALLLANRGRVRSQPGAGVNSLIKTALTAAAVGTTVYSGVLGAKIASAARSARQKAAPFPRRTPPTRSPNCSSSSAPSSGSPPR